ncbi:hypothetical protein IF1G_10946 [Cordyceps javanica]|uniref:Uncharacterized protein n=1 Tax=Cordyceps javanica TaxID=43265 RepID=A0A545ULY5_9HYPO|nr:hypothetical protein IF1G_10946 [Cordyceps javanica]
MTNAKRASAQPYARQRSPLACSRATELQLRPYAKPLACVILCLSYMAMQTASVSLLHRVHGREHGS